MREGSMRLCGVLAILAAGCPKTTATPAPDAAPPPAGMKTQYVADSVTVPDTPSESQMFGLNLDGDPQDRPDNLLGSLAATLASQDVDLPGWFSDAMAAGRLVMLFELQADDFTSWPNAGWQDFAGTATAGPPVFDGTGTFTVDPAGPTDAVLLGPIVGGQFSGRIATMHVSWPLIEGAPALDLDLVGARIVADVTATGCTNGRLAGAIPKDDIVNRLLPWVADAIDATIAADPGCAMEPPACGADAQTLLDLFDHGIACTDAVDCPADASTCDIPGGMTEGLCSCGAAACNGQLAGDLQVTTEELISDDLVSSILSPDVDLFDADGNFAPRQDGIEDSVSLGLGFSCANASFPSP